MKNEKNSLVINEKKYFQMDVDCRTCKTLKDHDQFRNVSNLVLNSH